MRPTVTDVARKAGVSPSTVSRALGGGIVSETTKAAVLAAASALGYTPNRAARALIGGRTDNIGLLVPDIANPFFTEIVKSVSAHVRRSEYQLLLGSSDEDTAREREMAQALQRTCDGVIACSPRMSDEEVCANADARTTVIVNRLIDGMSCVTADPTSGMEQAVQHLAALGHKHIAYVKGPAGSWSEQRRVEGLKLAQQLGMEVELIQSVTPTYNSGTLAADLVLMSKASAVIAFNDLLAIGILNRLEARGVDVPNDISLIGNDDIDMASMCRPQLTTIASPKEQMGALAAELLPRLLQSGGAEPEQIVLPATLVVRGSTAVARV
ncbi:MAG: LacI family transcriptional regulator [Propionibacteriaceae bacterium]|jgi:LacI family transcriptional regulator|nr:LacI family transcriptional regulator [Propionibacteriaceae bacterium]